MEWGHLMGVRHALVSAQRCHMGLRHRQDHAKISVYQWR